MAKSSSSIYTELLSTNLELLFMKHPPSADVQELLRKGVEELTPPIKRWIFLATTVADIAVPILNYGCIVVGLAVLAFMFVRTYKNVVFTKETLERGKKTLRRGSSFIVNGQHRLLILRDSYTLLNNISTDPDPEAEP